jgi:hypothetical protein
LDQKNYPLVLKLARITSEDGENMISPYCQTTHRFKNTAQFTVVTQKVEDAVIADISSTIKEIFKRLDKLDADAKHLSGLLWVFKTILNATLIPFDDSALGLKDRYRDILVLLEKQNIDPVLINSLKSAVEHLWSLHRNNKFEQLLGATRGLIDKLDDVGIVGKILYGNDPTCINFAISSLSNFGMNFTNIQTRRQLESTIFQKIFIVSPPLKTSIDLMKVIFNTGVTPEVNLVLYEHESFYPPSKVELPISSDFYKNIQKFKSAKIVAPKQNVDGDDSELNSWAEESFWSDIHGGSRTKIALSVGAHYMLFDSGEGAFMPVDGKTLHVSKKLGSGIEGRFTYDLSYVGTHDLTEGDHVLLRKNSSGFLLNVEIDCVDGEDGDDLILDQITDWKSALSALSITKDYSEIAQLMHLKGVAISPGKIKQWEGIDVIAPSSEAEFCCLISVLADEGKLSPGIKDVKKYAASKWADIHSYRVSRQKAGSRARQTVLETLLAQIEGLDIDSPDGVKGLGSSLGQNLLIRRVASIDQSLSYVLQSNLYKIDDLRRNKWLR